MKTKNLKFLFSLILVCTPLFLYSSRLSAQEPVISYLLGKAVIVRDTEKIEAKTNSVVKENDIITTSAKTTLILSLDENSRLKLKELSSIQIIKSESDDYQIKFIAGGLFSKINRPAGTVKYQIKTPDCVISVRGTEFFTVFGKKKKTGADLWVCVNEGSVDLKNSVMREETILKQGEGLNIQPGKKFPPAQKFKWTKKLNWNMSPEQGDVTDKTSINSAYGGLLTQDYE